MILIEDIKIGQKNVKLYNSLVNTSNFEWINPISDLHFMKLNFLYHNSSISLLDGYVKEQVLKKQNTIDTLTSNLLHTISYYLSGKLPLAYETMKVAFDSVKDILTRKSEIRFSTGFEFGFRARVPNQGESPLTSKKDMFHVPLTKRHQVSDQRYSIRGLPSIYLGRSIYTCYLELGKPALDDFFVSFFCFSQNKENVLKSPHIRLIDLTATNTNHGGSLLSHFFKKDEIGYIAALDRLVDDIILWPLIMSCSIIGKYPGTSPHFRAEYIVPQMLYQLCSENDEFTGVVYDSTKLTESNKDHLKNAMFNYALPIQDAMSPVYCPILAGQLSLTAPITAEMCNDLQINARYGHTSNWLPIISTRCDSLKNDTTILALDKMTMYFEELLLNFMRKKDLNGISPLYGWEKDS